MPVDLTPYSTRRAARSIGVSTTTLSRALRSGLTVDMAVKLGRLLGVDPRPWLVAQLDEALTAKKQELAGWTPEVVPQNEKYEPASFRRRSA